jgi:hypothetical protein
MRYSRATSGAEPVAIQQGDHIMPDDNAPVVEPEDDEDEMPEGPARPEGGSGMDPLSRGPGNDDDFGPGPGEIKPGG